MITSERIFAVVGSIVAVLLQVLLAPHISIAVAVPNFIVAFTVAVALLKPTSYGCIMPFVLGLAFDFIGGGPLGAMAFSLTAFTVLAARLFPRVDNDSLFMTVAMLVVAVLLVEVSYAAFVVLFGFEASFIEAIVYRALPCFVYDAVLALVIFIVGRRFVQPAAAIRTELTQLR